MISTSIIIVSYNTKKILQDCIDSILKNVQKKTYEIIVIDNNSQDGSQIFLDKLEKDKKIKLIQNKSNLGFAKANNQGAKIAVGEYLLFLNSDTIIKEDSVNKVYNLLKNQDKIAVCSVKLLWENGKTQQNGGGFPFLKQVFLWMFFIDRFFALRKIKALNPFHPVDHIFYNTNQYKDWLTGAFFMLKKELFDKVKGFDEDYFMYVEELDLCYRLKKYGYKNYYFSESSIIHLGGKSGNSEFSLISELKNLRLFYRKHFSLLKQIIFLFLIKTGIFLRIIVNLFINNKKAKIYGKAFFIV